MDNEEKQNDKPIFNNAQMLLHYADISDEWNLKLSQGLTTDESFDITYLNHVINIDSGIIQLAYIYEELNNSYRLEARTLIEKLITRMGAAVNSGPILVGFIKEIIKQKKLIDEKNDFKKKVVWLKK